MSQSAKLLPNSGHAKALLIFSVIVLSMPFWLPLIGGYQALATKIMIWAIFALGFDILFGLTGYLSFGHAAFFGVSAYSTGLVLLHLTDEMIPAMLIAMGVTLTFSIVLGFIVLRRTGIYFSILTLAFGEMLHSAALSIFQEWTGGDNGLTGLQSPVLFGNPLEGLPIFYITAVIGIVAFYVARRIAKSPFGLMLRAIKSNRTRLEFTGVNVRGYELMGFVISAMYAGLAGSLMVIYEPYVATKFLQWTTSGEVVIMSVIGGVGTLFGPMFGAAFMLYFENVVQGVIGEQWKLVLGLVFMAVVIFLPGGFVDGGRRLWAMLTGKQKQHGKIDTSKQVTE